MFNTPCRVGRQEALRSFFSELADDEGEFRVISAELANSFVDLGAVWHGKPTAWDFRSHTAPKRTHGLMSAWFGFIVRDEIDLAAKVAGLANIKYIVDQRNNPPNIKTTRNLRRAYHGAGFVAYENLALRPYVQAFPDAHLMVGSSRSRAVRLLAHLADRNVGLVHLDETPSLSDTLLTSTSSAAPR